MILEHEQSNFEAGVRSEDPIEDARKKKKKKEKERKKQKMD